MSILPRQCSGHGRIFSLVLSCVSLWSACGSGSEEPSEPADSREGTAERDSASQGCTEPPLRCAGAQLEACADGVWEPAEACATEQLCEDSLQICRATGDCAGQCLPPACEAGQRQCDGTFVVICNEGRTGLVAEENCGLACSGMHCSEGACEADPCSEPGFSFDENGDIQECSEDCSTLTLVAEG